MIDKTKPAPGHDVVEAHDGWCVTSDAYGLVRAQILTMDEAIAKSHELFERSAAPAVLDFAERVAAWVTCGPNDATLAYVEWYRETAHVWRREFADYAPWLRDQILAAARGERSLPYTAGKGEPLLIASVEVTNGDVVLVIGGERFLLSREQARALSRVLRGASKCAEPRPDMAPDSFRVRVHLIEPDAGDA